LQEVYAKNDKPNDQVWSSGIMSDATSKYPVWFKKYKFES